MALNDGCCPDSLVRRICRKGLLALSEAVLGVGIYSALGADCDSCDGQVQ